MPEPPRYRVCRRGLEEWRVYEYMGAPPASCGASLVFESEGVIRRVRDFPADWHHLPDEELMQLSWRR